MIKDYSCKLNANKREIRIELSLVSAKLFLFFFENRIISMGLRNEFWNGPLRDSSCENKGQTSSLEMVLKVSL